MAQSLEWNAGGWFGGQIGATAWIGVAGLLTVFADLPSGAAALALFAIPNVLGWLLWRRRPLDCYAATQLLMAVSGICGLATVRVLDRAGYWAAIQTGGQIPAASTYWIVGLTFAGLMLVFHWRFGRR